MPEGPLSGTGIVNVSTSLLREWIMLPAGLEIVDAHMSQEHQCVAITVKHPNTPIAPDGAVLPLLTPVFQTMIDEDGVKWYRLREIRVSEQKEIK
jgi:hypothetical protein